MNRIYFSFMIGEVMKYFSQFQVYIYDVHETTVLGNIISGLGAVVAATRRFGQNRVVFWR